MIDPDKLELVSRLKDEPGYILLCDYLQSYVDNLADQMAADDLTSENRLQRLYIWKATRDTLHILKTAPQSIAQDLQHENNQLPPELRIDPHFLALRNLYNT